MTLEQVRLEFEEVVRRARALEGPGWNTRPAAGGWSPAECVEHLTLTTDQYRPLVTAALRDAAPGAPPYRLDFWGRFLSWYLEPPYRVGVKTFPPFEPRILERVLPRFEESQEFWFDTLRQCQGLAIDRVKLTSPFASRVRYSVYSTLVIMAAHQRRHLWQAEQALQKA